MTPEQRKEGLKLATRIQADPFGRSNADVSTTHWTPTERELSANVIAAESELSTQRERIAELTATNAEICKRSKVWQDELATLRGEANRYKTAIENADHAPRCGVNHQCFVCDNEHLWPDGERPHPNECNCFKRALSDPPCRKPACQTCLDSKQVQGPAYGSGQSDTLPCPDCAPPCNTCGGKRRWCLTHEDCDLTGPCCQAQNCAACQSSKGKQ